MRNRLLSAVAAAVLLCAASPNMALAAGAAGSPIEIGLSTPTTGTAANLGQNEAWGAQLAVDEINAKGGVLGRPLQLHVEDNRCNPSEGVTGVSQLISEQKVAAVIGAMCSSVTLAIMPIVQREKVPLLVDVSTAPAIAKESGVGGNHWTFKINPSDSSLAQAMAGYLKAEGNVKTVAIVGENTDYGRGGAAALSQALESRGIKVVSTDFFTQGTSDFSTLLTRLTAEHPDAVALYALSADQVNFLRQYQSFGLKIPLTGRLEISGPQEPLLRSGAFNGSTTVFPYSPLVDTSQNQRFVKEFQAKYKVAPIYQSFEGYQAVFVLADAIARAHSASPEAIRDALGKTDYQSMMGGTIKFDEHDEAHDNAVVMKIVGSKVVVAKLVHT